MTRTLQAAALLLALAATGAAAADTRQLAASAGIDAAEAATMSLTEIARGKFNAEARNDDRHYGARPTAMHAAGPGRDQLIAAAGLTPAQGAAMTLTEIVSVKSNREVGGAERVVIRSSRSYPATSRSDARQLAASAGLGVEAARGMTLQQIYRATLERGDDDIRVGAN